MKITDVTELVNFDYNDGECLPLTRCICGQEFASWDFILSVYPDTPRDCSSCGRKFYFDVRIFQVEDTA